MSVVLNGSTQYLDLENAAANLTGGTMFPCSVSCWMKTTDLDQTSALVSIDDGSSKQNISQFRGSVAGDYVAAACYDGAWDLAISSTGVSSGTWTHVLVVFNSATDRRVYIDASKQTDSGSCSSSSGAGGDIGIGCRFPQGTPSLYFGGKIAEVAVWDMALTDANATSLAGGSATDSIQSSNLVYYWSLYGDANSDGGSIGTNLTEYNSPTYDTGDHPIAVGATYVELAGTSSLTFGSTASIAEYVSLAGSTGLTFGSTSALTGYVSVAGSSGITFGNDVSILVFGPPSGDKLEKYVRRLVGCGNDSFFYEDL